MNDYVYVLFFSKFSKACNKIIDMIANYPEIRDNMTSICVDNKILRNIITLDGPLKISKVPCIMKVYETTGHIEQFEGEIAFTLITPNESNTTTNNTNTTPVTMITPTSEDQIDDLGISSVNKKNIIPQRGIVSKHDGVTNLANQMQKERDELFPVLQKSL